MQVYHPNFSLHGTIDTGSWKPQHDIAFYAYVLLNLFENPNLSDALNQQAAQIMCKDVKSFDSLVSRSLAGETLTLDCSFEGGAVRQVHNFFSQREMNAVRPDPSWTQLFPHNVCARACVRARRFLFCCFCDSVFGFVSRCILNSCYTTPSPSLP